MFSYQILEESDDEEGEKKQRNGGNNVKPTDSNMPDSPIEQRVVVARWRSVVLLVFSIVTILVIISIGAGIYITHVKTLMGKPARAAIAISNWYTPDLPLSNVDFVSPSQLIYHDDSYLICMTNQQGKWVVRSVVNLNRLGLGYLQGSVLTKVYCSPAGDKLVMRNEGTSEDLAELSSSAKKTYLYNTGTGVLEVAQISEEEITKQFSGDASDLSATNPASHFLNGLSKDSEYSFLLNFPSYQLDDHQFIFVTTLNNGGTAYRNNFRIFTYNEETHSVSVQKIQ
ncbi:MAG: hypothetical protein FWF45_04650 [Coriobacteriia bacterium]|nr:hypothetical protein [Coriobacteriia bacterium]